MTGSLGSLAQLDFSAGMWRAVARHLIPQRGAWDLSNLLLDEDGSPYRRGGSEYLSTAAFGTGLRFLWDGQLTPGPRTVIANVDDFGVLDAAEAPINLGLGGLSGPKKAVEVAGLLFIGGGTIYGGSRKTAAYSTGTADVTTGSKTVTGTGTLWLAGVDVGMLFGIGGQLYAVASVDSDTQLTLRDPFEGGTATGLAYTLSHILAAASPYRPADLYAVAAERLFSLEGNRAYFTEPGKPHVLDPTEAFHELPEGSALLGGGGISDRLLAFATSGLWMISNLHFDGTDAAGNVQHRVERVADDKILWSHEGIATYAGGVIAPCADHVWLLDGIGAAVPLTLSIAGLYRDYVQAGYKTGLAAVIRSHYFLPILDQSNVVKDLLACRLDRPFRSQLGTAYPWTHMDDFSRDLAALAVRTGSGSTARNPVLLGASTRPSGRVLGCNGWFGPQVAQKNEPDGSTHSWRVVTRDYATGDGSSQNTVRRARLRYELIDAATDDPTIQGFYSIGVQQPGGAFYGSAFYGSAGPSYYTDPETVSDAPMSGSAPEDDGRKPFVWTVNKRTRFIRFRFQSSSPASKMVIRALELLIRPTNER